MDNITQAMDTSDSKASGRLKVMLAKRHMKKKKGYKGQGGPVVGKIDAAKMVQKSDNLGKKQC